MIGLLTGLCDMGHGSSVDDLSISSWVFDDNLRIGSQMCMYATDTLVVPVNGMSNVCRQKCSPMRFFIMSWVSSVTCSKAGFYPVSMEMLACVLHSCVAHHQSCPISISHNLATWFVNATAHFITEFLKSFALALSVVDYVATY